MSFEGMIEDIVRRVVREELHGSPAAHPEPDLVTLADAAKRTQVSVSWLKARIAAGELAVFGKNRMRRVKPADVRALLSLRTTPAPQSPAARAKAIFESIPGGRR